jgi:hypothetical protein
MPRPHGLLMLVTVAGILIPATYAAASQDSRPPQQRFGVRLVDVPVSQAHNPRALRYIIDYLPPGHVIHRRIMVINQESHLARFTVYPDAARITRNLFTGDAGATHSMLTRWITVRRPVLNLAAGASATDMITIKAPKHATKGEHYGVIWAQQVAQARSARGFAVNEIARVGIRIYLAVGPGGAPPTKFAITSLTGRRTARDQLLISAHVKNTGGRAVDLNGSARLSGGPGTESAGPFTARQVVTLAPGQSGAVVFPVSRQLSPGRWRATILLASGLTAERVSATISLPAPPAGPGSSALPDLLWVLGLACVAVLLGLAFAMARRTRQARRATA